MKLQHIGVSNLELAKNFNEKIQDELVTQDGFNLAVTLDRLFLLIIMKTKIICDGINNESKIIEALFKGLPSRRELQLYYFSKLWNNVSRI